MLAVEVVAVAVAVAIAVTIAVMVAIVVANTMNVEKNKYSSRTNNNDIINSDSDR